MAQQYDIGMIGLGVMGSNLVLNMADHGFAVAGLDQSTEKVHALQQAAQGRVIFATTTLADFIHSLKIPRAIMLLVPAGAVVDAVIHELQPLLSPGDLLIDGGNSHFTDTNRRQKTLESSGIEWLGVGVSGGEAGARVGPCLMPGGNELAYERVRPIFESIAARVEEQPCVAYMGPSSAGHYVKMVHNGIEYALMQLIAESYQLMKYGLGFDADTLAKQYLKWNGTSELNSFLIEITAAIFLQPNDAPSTNQRLINVIKDIAKQKGTGAWTSVEALQLQVPTPTIDAAVMMRDLSADSIARQAAYPPLQLPCTILEDSQQFVHQLANALYCSFILVYAQGLALLAKASSIYHYSLNLAQIAQIWRGGCIIRSALLEQITQAYQYQANLPLLFTDPNLAAQLATKQTDLRAVIHATITLGLPAPGLMTALAYYDAYRSAELPTNLVQAQRDYFGAHGYERTDKPGYFHTKWS